MNLPEPSTTVLTSSTVESVSDEPLVVVVRGEFVESIHRGSIAVVDVSGSVVAGIGNVYQRAFLRSGAKPFQAMPALLTGGIERFGITNQELAVLCASHTGEPRHLEAVLSVLGKIGLDECALQCGAHPPLDPEIAAERWRRGLDPTPVCNNCSGAHAGMLLACVAAGWSIYDYGDPKHPLQVQIRRILTEFSGAEPGEMEEAVDNCAVPTFRLSLARAATAFARLASGLGISSELASAAHAIRRAMTTHPEMVGGAHRLDSDLMRVAAGDLVAKAGAGGFQGIGHTERGIGLALKVSDGAAGAATTATMRALSDLALTEPTWLEELNTYREPAVLNMRGEIAGRMFSVFDLGELR